MSTKVFFSLLVSAVLVLTACNRQSEYSQMVEEGLASETRQDSIFLGFSFGMTSDEFYDYCWEMNKRQLFMNGPTNNTVQYDISNSLRHPGKMNFYPTFREDKIVEMPVEFTYDAFSWREDYGVDSLLEDVLVMYEEWYGEFTKFTHSKKGSVYVNIQSNRQIRLFVNDLKNSVNAVFTDLSVEKPAAEKNETS